MGSDSVCCCFRDFCREPSWPRSSRPSTPPRRNDLCRQRIFLLSTGYPDRAVFSWVPGSSPGRRGGIGRAWLDSPQGSAKDVDRARPDQVTILLRQTHKKGVVPIALRVIRRDKCSRRWGFSSGSRDTRMRRPIPPASNARSSSPISATGISHLTSGVSIRNGARTMVGQPGIGTAEAAGRHAADGCAEPGERIGQPPAPSARGRDRLRSI